jgi:murein DD-endopeptidase MepM/ murein hydrolase activator NlpD
VAPPAAPPDTSGAVSALAPYAPAAVMPAPGYFSATPDLSALLSALAQFRSTAAHPPLLHFHSPSPAAPASPAPTIGTVLGWIGSAYADASPPHRQVSPAAIVGRLPVAVRWLLAAGAIALVIAVVRWLAIAAVLRVAGGRRGRAGLAWVVLAGALATILPSTGSHGAAVALTPPRAPALTPSDGGPAPTDPGTAATDGGTASTDGTPEAPSPLRSKSTSPAADTVSSWVLLCAVETNLEQDAQATSDGSADPAVAASPAKSAALAAEEALYRTTAGDPAAASTLADAATRTGDADVIAAVNTDLAIAHAMLDQQSAADATLRSVLSQYGSLAASQLSAISLGAALITPLVGVVTQGFGPSDLAIEPSRSFHGVWYPHFHSGLDLAAPMGTPVHAAAGGVVLFAGVSSDAAGRPVGYGRYVVIAHKDGFATLYGHLSSIAVHAGDTVHQGEVIGAEGSTGNSTGPHLHFEVRLDGDPVDPLPYVRSQLSGGTAQSAATGG